jgi:Domain of Unknown Function (DUF1080)
MFQKSIAMRFFALALGLVLVSSLAAADTGGFTPLFNGKNMEGFKFFFDPKAPKDSDPAKTWIVKDAAIICTGKPQAFFYTEKSYKNYVITYEWRYPEGSAEKSNSGCLVHIQEPLKIWPKCIEPQGRYYDHGKLFMMGLGKDEYKIPKFDEATLKSVLKPMGQWSKTEITCSGDGKIVVKVNGKLISEGETVLTSGPIGFQSEGSEIHFRNMHIKQLP